MTFIVNILALCYAAYLIYLFSNENLEVIPRDTIVFKIAVIALLILSVFLAPWIITLLLALCIHFKYIDKLYNHIKTK